MRTRKKMRASILCLLVLLATATASVVSTTPAMAAGCYWTSCNGQDPQGMGCSPDAGDLTSFSWTGTYFELRYSRACNAVWARTSNTGYPCYGGYIYVFAYSDYEMQHFIRGQSTQQACFSTNWSPMESFTYWI